MAARKKKKRRKPHKVETVPPSSIPTPEEIDWRDKVHVPPGAPTPEEIAERSNSVREGWARSGPLAVRIIEMREDPLVSLSLDPGYVGYVVRLAFTDAVTEDQLAAVLRLGFQAWQVARTEKLEQQDLAQGEGGIARGRGLD